MEISSRCCNPPQIFPVCKPSRYIFYRTSLLSPSIKTCKPHTPYRQKATWIMNENMIENEKKTENVQLPEVGQKKLLRDCISLMLHPRATIHSVEEIKHQYTESENKMIVFVSFMAPLYIKDFSSSSSLMLSSDWEPGSKSNLTGHDWRLLSACVHSDTEIMNYLSSYTDSNVHVRALFKVPNNVSFAGVYGKTIDP